MANAFTPEQIAQILEEFFKTVGARQYIGARYVPIFGRKDETSIEWDNTKPYEPLTIVLYQGNSYTSRQYVPEGVQITNEDFWAITGNYNAQIEEYRRETARALQAAQNAQGDIDTLLPKSEFNAENTIKAYIDSNITAIEEKAKAKAMSFANVAEMKAYENLYVGAICKTAGFHEDGDFGAAWYVITSTGAANDMDIIACGNLYAHLIVENSINPKQLGAYGDGVHDDTDAIQHAMDINNGWVIFSDGVYNISETIGTNGNVAMSGKALIKVIANLDFAVKTNLFVDIETESIDTPRNLTIHMNIDCNNLANVGIGVNRINNSKISAQVLNFKNTGLYCRYADNRPGACAENVLSVNARNDRFAVAGSEAMYLNISDTVIDSVFAKDVQIGLHVATSDAIINVVHAWLYTFGNELYSESKCVLLDANAGLVAKQIYHDTMRYGIYCMGGNFASMDTYRYLHATSVLPASESTDIYEPFNFYNNGNRNAQMYVAQMNNESEPLYANVCKQYGYLTAKIEQLPNRSLNYQYKGDLNDAPIGCFLAEYAADRNFPSDVTTSAKVLTVGDGYKFNQFLTIGNSIEYIYCRTISKDSATSYSASSWRKLNPQF